MAFPEIPTVANSRLNGGVQANTTALRSTQSLGGLTKNAGDLLIAIFVAYQCGTGTDAAFSGWDQGFTEFYDTSTTTTLAIGMAYKFSDGTETGSVTATQASVTGHCSDKIMSISGAHESTPPEAGGRGNSTAGTANPAAFNPAGWDVEDTLWISVAGQGETSTAGAWTGITAAPTNYTNASISSMSADAVGAVQNAVAFRQLSAASEDIGTWTMDTSNVRDSSVTLAIRQLILTPAQVIARTGMLVNMPPMLPPPRRGEF